ncbi:hypothetical protein VOLCADRAFT_77298 [Volvox carteri f. nagariensis]|uniref:Transmembrane 9 superfamily member n=1 Tax=Volvox carteri f. nagariensis TaxID=3068 RepID=D8UE04_VOLCA|nr:uncharacterized protein VOLCADRAFT_77298 [Volvox carteri f. nagariensis]EFJ42043.1 hypothetical protein VOLCADRAFT_77298 [Volvox carteri f. nagariensis]|eukprot:XP_002956918.1 hypothetical protein VOLCADRAFT_77298 [Volvox carteri f. nagariensis]
MQRLDGQRLLGAVLLSVLLCGVSAYYVPGAYPAEFQVGDLLPVYASSLTSFDTELPLDYYSAPFCKPAEGVKRIANTANPGTILEGIRIENSPYNFSMKVKQSGLLACPSGSYGPLDSKEVKLLKRLIDQHYRVNLILDNLPVTVYNLLDETEFLRPGFEVGYKVGDKYYINNHLVFNVLVYQTHGEYTAARKQYVKSELADIKALGVDPAYYMVVGFEVSPCSIARKAGEDVEAIVCGVDGDSHITPQEIREGADIVFTYDVFWQDSKIKWASRWDAYLRMPGGKVHWFSIVNSLLVVLVMATIVAMILVRTIRRDLAKYESLMVDGTGPGDARDEAGWKLVAGDVFRAPANSAMLAVQVGTGVQILATSLVTLVLAALGFLSPAARGALLTAGMLFFVLLAGVAGFVAVYVWGLMERSFTSWQAVCARVAVYYPGINLLVFTVLNLVIVHTGSTGAVPLGMYFSLGCAWFLVATPLTFLGGMIAVRVPLLDWPVKTNQIPRHIPPAPLSANPVLLFLAAGVLPFGTMFIELYFAMTSLWLGYFYYLFGFVLLIGALTCVINTEIAVLCTYVQLCAEDYAWWWRSFYRGASVSLYIGLYALGFLMSSMSSLAGFIPIFIYLCYMTLFVLAFYYAMGALGFGASLWFVYSIFKAVKAD